MDERVDHAAAAWPEAIIGLPLAGKRIDVPVGDEIVVVRPLHKHAVYVVFHWPWSEPPDSDDYVTTHSLLSQN